MYSRPSSSRMRAPRPSRMKGGVPPTARKARTGELTPPGISADERSKRLALLSPMGAEGFFPEGSRQLARPFEDVGRIEERRDHRGHVRARGHHVGHVAKVDPPDGGDRQ